MQNFLLVQKYLRAVLCTRAILNARANLTATRFQGWVFFFVEIYNFYKYTEIYPIQNFKDPQFSNCH